MTALLRSCFDASMPHYQNMSSHRRKTLAIVAGAITLLGLSTLGLLIVTQTGGLQSLLQKYSIVLTPNQVFSLTLGTAIGGSLATLGGGATLIIFTLCCRQGEVIPLNGKELHVPISNSSIPILAESTQTTSVKTIKPVYFPEKFTIDKMNLGNSGKVMFTAPQKFEELFQAIDDQAEALPLITLPELPAPKSKVPQQQGALQKLGRSIYSEQSGITQKMRKEHEDAHAMARESAAQQFFNTNKKVWGLRSMLPTPIYCDEHCLYYQNPPGYHTYLTDIDVDEQFNASLEICAHDLGILLRKGIAYPELISVFHDISNTGSEQDLEGEQKGFRFYTAFPRLFGYYTRLEGKNGSAKFNFSEGGFNMFGSFPGDIEKVCDPDEHLFPDMGAAGLRDLGDYITLEDFLKRLNSVQKMAVESVSKKLLPCTYPMAVAHFLSLYQMIFMLVIAKREQKRETWDPQTITESFCRASHALL